MKLILGDCIEKMRDIESGSVGMVLADPPYGTTRCKWDSVIPLETMWEQLKRVIKPNGAIVITASQPFTSVLACSNLQMFRYSLVWEKTTATGHMNAKKMFMRAHEDILVFYKKLPTYNPQLTYGHKRKVSSAESKRNCKKTEIYGEHGLTGYDSTYRYPRSVIKTSTDKQKKQAAPYTKASRIDRVLN